MAAVLPATKRAIAEDRLANRCEAKECNFFEAVPAGGDCYVMKHIVHDWPDGSALQLLRNIRKVIAPNGKLVLAEAVLEKFGGDSMEELKHNFDGYVAEVRARGFQPVAERGAPQSE